MENPRPIFVGWCWALILCIRVFAESWVLISIKVNVSIYLQTDYWHSSLVSPPPNIHTYNVGYRIVNRATYWLSYDSEALCTLMFYDNDTVSYLVVLWQWHSVLPCCLMTLRLCHAPGWPARWVALLLTGQPRGAPLPGGGAKYIILSLQHCHYLYYTSHKNA